MHTSQITELYLSESQYQAYQDQLDLEEAAVKLSRCGDPPGKHKYTARGIVNDSIEFTVEYDHVTARCTNLSLGRCPDVADPEGRTIKLSSKQLAKYTPSVGDTIKWTPQGQFYSDDELITVYQHNSSSGTILNDDLDFTFL